MAFSLVSAFRERVSKCKDQRMKEEAQPDVSYPTGFLSFDFMNGNVVHVKSDTLDFSYNSIGIVDGSMVTVIGRSGCGKTTWIMQSAGNIIRPYEQGAIYMDSLEGGIVDTRVSTLTKLPKSELKKRYIPRNTGITAENFYERLKMVYDLKMENREEFLYDTGLYSEDGERIFKLQPTVYILDSVAMLMPDKYTDEDELSGQMSVTAAAKTNTNVFKKIIPLLKAANIILFIVNHITEDVNITPFSRSQGQLSYLKPGERLGGGRAIIYVTNLLIRLDDHTKMKSDEGLGIDGILVDFTLLKSRTASSGSSVTLVFDYSTGFDQDLSLLYFLKTQKKIGGAGAYLYIEGHPDHKFAQKNFKTKLQTDSEFQQIVMAVAYDSLRETINDIQKIEESFDNNVFDITTAILNHAA